MSYVLYHQSIEGATLTYSATPDTNYPITNMQDRYKNTFFKDTGIGVPAVDIYIDFGAVRACSHVILGNYIATAQTNHLLIVQYGTDDNGSDFDKTSFSSEITSATLTNYLKTFTSQTKRHWKLRFDGNGDEVENLQIGTIFLGAAVTLSHSPELDITQSGEYSVNINNGVGGIRAGSIDNTTARRIWEYPFKLLSETDKTNLQTFRDSVYMNNGLSRYPFFWSPDTGTTLYYLSLIHI